MKLASAITTVIMMTYAAQALPLARKGGLSESTAGAALELDNALLPKQRGTEVPQLDQGDIQDTIYTRDVSTAGPTREPLATTVIAERGGGFNFKTSILDLPANIRSLFSKRKSKSDVKIQTPGAETLDGERLMHGTEFSGYVDPKLTRSLTSTSKRVENSANKLSRSFSTSLERIDRAKQRSNNLEWVGPHGDEREVKFHMTKENGHPQVFAHTYYDGLVPVSAKQADSTLLLDEALRPVIKP